MKKSSNKTIIIFTFLLVTLFCCQVNLNKAAANPTPPTPTPPTADFAITATAGPGGTISPEGEGMFAYPGQSFTFTITPNFGYQITDVKVDGISQGKISTYNLTNIQSSHEISATFSPTQTPTIIVVVGIVVAVVVLACVLFVVSKAKKRIKPTSTK
jgi:hypothetical protein